MFFMTADTLLIFDNLSQKIKIVSNAYLTQRDPEEVYKESGQDIRHNRKLKVPLSVIMTPDKASEERQATSLPDRIRLRKYCRFHFILPWHKRLYGRCQRPGIHQGEAMCSSLCCHRGLRRL